MIDLYTSQYYNGIAPSSQKSAEVVVPIVMEIVRPRSVIDIGCGLGHWLAEFQKHRITDLVGIDGAYVPLHQLVVDPTIFWPRDITSSIGQIGDFQAFDLVVCLEVAEHLPLERAESFLDDLTRHAPVVLFSAAIPGQDGTGHVNCSWPSWWAERFARRGFVAYDLIRPIIWSDQRVAWWYRQNILIFSSREIDFPRADPVMDLVHPELWRQAR